jgi:hypothetical protein
MNDFRQSVDQGLHSFGFDLCQGGILVYRDSFRQTRQRCRTVAKPFARRHAKVLIPRMKNKYCMVEGEVKCIHHSRSLIPPSDMRPRSKAASLLLAL